MAKKILSIKGVPLTTEDHDKRPNEKYIYDNRMRHMGRFAIPREMVFHNLDEVMRLMKDMLVIRAEMMMMTDCVEYTAISPKYFRSLAEGEVAPGYDIVMNAEGEFRCKEITNG